MVEPLTGPDASKACCRCCCGSVEYKYDGQRAQIHCCQGENGTPRVRLFSRNCDENTSRFPDVVAQMQAAVADSVTSYVIDAEIVAVDQQSGQLLPFQQLSTRSRVNVGAEVPATRQQQQQQQHPLGSIAMPHRAGCLHGGGRT